ncbi:helix-turn-helix transcriptional regulator [Bacillus cereus]
MENMQECKTILRKYRESKGFTIDDVSVGIQIPKKTLYAIEIGTRGIKEDKAKKLADFLEVPIEQLFNPTYYYPCVDTG